MMGAILPFPYYPHYNELNYEKKMQFYFFNRSGCEVGKNYLLFDSFDIYKNNLTYRCIFEFKIFPRHSLWEHTEDTL